MRIILLISLAFTLPCLGSQTSLTLSGNPQPLTITSATAGQQPNSVSDSSTNYSITVASNHTASILAALSTGLPSNTFLAITLSAPPQAQNFPSTTLQTTAQTVVSNIKSGTYRTLPITYSYSATVAAGTLSQNTKTVVFTVLEN